MVWVTAEDQEAAMLAMRSGAPQNAMIQVFEPDEAWDTPRTPIVSYLNEDIILKSLSVSKACINGDDMELGAAISDELNFSVRVAVPNNILGKVVMLTIDWLYDGDKTASMVPFTGIITQVAKVTSTVWTVKALDSMIWFDKPFNSYELYPAGGIEPDAVTVRNLFRNIVENVGYPYISQNGVIIPDNVHNDALLIKPRELDGYGYTYRQVIRWCAQLMCCNVRIERLPPYRMEFYKVTWNAFSYAHEDVFFRKLCGEDPGSPSHSHYSVRITEGDTTLAEPDLTYGERVITISDNVLLQNVLAHHAHPDEVIAEVHTNLQNDVHMFSFGTQSFDGDGMSQWYVEPWDQGYAYDTSFIVTSVIHRLNGKSSIVAKVKTATASAYSPSAIFTPSEAEAINQAAGKAAMEEGESVLSLALSEIDALRDELCYKAGDTFTGEAFFYGYLGGGKKVLLVTFPLPKIVTSTPNITQFIVHGRIPSGGWLGGTDSLDILSMITKVDLWGNLLTIHATSPNDLASVTNIPVNGHLSVTITF